MLTKTEAVVVKSMKYRDTSKIVTFYTRQFGKLKGIAKGARRTPGKFGTGLEPLSYVTLVLYKKEHRDLHLISQCDTIESFGTIHDSIEKMSVGFSVLELIDRLAHDEEENPALFSLIKETMYAIDENSTNIQSLGRSFQIRCAAVLGYAPALDACTECGKSLLEIEQRGVVGFQAMNGAIVCSECNGKGNARRPVGYRTLSAPAFKILQHLLSSRIAGIPSMHYTESIGNEIDETLRLYLRYHFDNMNDLKSAQVFKSIA